VFSYIFFRFFVLKISYELETVEIPIEKLKSGMRLAEVIIKEGKTYKKVRSERYSLSDYLKGKFLKAIHSTSEEGLSKYEVRKLKKLKKENKLTFETIRVYKVIPFGIFIFIGNLLVLLFIFSGFKIY
ncbi:MAG: hypothetical protein J7L39_02845, partial [Candidatus Aenigmarchaeota archaeon]|nr:hypothetical protein [Candidatus Aenigmarchaeota archaeon]